MSRRALAMTLLFVFLALPAFGGWSEALVKALENSEHALGFAEFVESILLELRAGTMKGDQITSLDELSERLDDSRRALRELDLTFPEREASACRTTIDQLVDCKTREKAKARLDECDQMLDDGLHRLRDLKQSLEANRAKAADLERVLKAYMDSAESSPAFQFWANRWLDFYFGHESASSLRGALDSKLKEVESALTNAEREAKIGGWFGNVMRRNLPDCKKPDLDEAGDILKDGDRRAREDADRRERDADDIRDANRPPPSGGLQDVECTQTTIVLKVWDHGAQDGDIITLKLGSEAVLAGFNLDGCGGAEPAGGVCVQRRALRPGVRIPVVVTAHNEGSQPPNTASIKVEGGCTPEMQQYQLKQGESASIEIRAVAASRPRN
jgi:hypothetical protein